MSTEPHAGNARHGAGPVIAALAASVGVVVVLGAGLWVLGALVTSDYATSIGLGIAWFAIVGVIVWRLSRRWPGIRRAAGGTFLVVAAASAIGFYWTSIRDVRVDEQVATGVAASQVAAAGQAPTAPGRARTNVELARGGFVSKAHSTRGTAAAVALPDGGRRLTLTDFATDNGPDLRVYLVRGPVRVDGDVDDAVDLGRLKGNIGNQQYTVPTGVDIPTSSTVVIWCRAFSVNFAQADLRAS
jgi:hypothetical protein